MVAADLRALAVAVQLDQAAVVAPAVAEAAGPEDLPVEAAAELAVAVAAVEW